jgi:hypothetical protein
MLMIFPFLPPRDFMNQFNQGNEASKAKLLAITTTRNSMHRTMDGSFYAKTDKWVFSILSYDTSSSTKILLHHSTRLPFVKCVFQFPTTLPCFREDSYILPWKPFFFHHFVYIFLKCIYKYFNLFLKKTWEFNLHASIGAYYDVHVV